MEKGLLSFSYFGGRCLKKKPGLEFRLDANFKQSCINFTTQIKHILTEEVNICVVLMNSQMLTLHSALSIRLLRRYLCAHFIVQYIVRTLIFISEEITNQT